MDAKPYQVPQAELTPNVFCRQCGSPMAATAFQCPHCRADQNFNSKSKGTAAVLALLLGGLGIHRFYLGQWWGIFYLLAFFTWVPAVIAIVEGIVFLCTDDARWQQKYGNVKGGSSALVAIVAAVVVVAIIGILAAIALPAYSDYTKRAKAAAEQAQQRQSQPQP